MLGVKTHRESWREGAARAPDTVMERDRKFVVALARGLEVLRAFNPGEGLLGNQEIACRTGLPKATVSRLTYTLMRLGYLSHFARLGKYQLAPAAMLLGYSALANMRLREVARPFMQELADYSRASVGLGSRDRLSLVYIENCRSQAGVTLRLDVGARIPIATTAMGRALISALPTYEREFLFAHIARNEGGRWPRLRAGLEQAIEDVARRGFTLSDGEWQPDVSAVGVPLVPADGSGVFALNCGAPAYQIARERLERDIGPRLVNLVRNIEIALTGR